MVTLVNIFNICITPLMLLKGHVIILFCVYVVLSMAHRFSIFLEPQIIATYLLP